MLLCFAAKELRTKLARVAGRLQRKAAAPSRLSDLRVDTGPGGVPRSGLASSPAATQRLRQRSEILVDPYRRIFAHADLPCGQRKVSASKVNSLTSLTFRS